MIETKPRVAEACHCLGMRRAGAEPSMDAMWINPYQGQIRMHEETGVCQARSLS
jgi:hypothetical protein